jgi:hypothetical protein
MVFWRFGRDSESGLKRRKSSQSETVHQAMAADKLP